MWIRRGYQQAHSTLFFGNRAQEEVIGVGTYQLKLRLGHTLLLHDMLRWSLVGFLFFYGHGYLSNDFFMLDLDHSSFSFITHNDNVF